SGSLTDAGVHQLCFFLLGRCWKPLPSVLEAIFNCCFLIGTQQTGPLEMWERFIRGKFLSDCYAGR
ncbi:unnamed protein product, partial [Prunus brigantina]